jgi:hypothetical protein
MPENLIRIHFRPGAYQRANAYPSGTINYWPWQTLDALRPSLDIAAVNTGRQYNMPPGPYGIGFDDVEGLHAVVYEDGRMALTSGIEMPMAAYRGQTREHHPCVPGLGRLQHLGVQLLAICRSVAFEDAIADHPYVQFSSQARLLDTPLRIDLEGMAQHHGLATDLLDVTSNYDVASFFATCEWNAAQHSFQPVLFSEQPGVMYRFTPCLFTGADASAQFQHVGWQPLHRPAQLRADALRMKKGQDFGSLPAVQRVRFRQSAKVSHRIWQSFDKGRSLFPKDAAAELAEQAKLLMTFTRQQLDRAWQRLAEWHTDSLTELQRESAIADSGLALVDHAVLNWDGLDVERDEGRMRSQLQMVLEQVRYRLAAYG